MSDLPADIPQRNLSVGVVPIHDVGRLPRVQPWSSQSWYAASDDATHVVVPVSAVVTRECPTCGGDGIDEWDNEMACNTCDFSGILEAIVYDPHGILGGMRYVTEIEEGGSE